MRLHFFVPVDIFSCGHSISYAETLVNIFLSKNNNFSSKNRIGRRLPRLYTRCFSSDDGAVEKNSRVKEGKIYPNIRRRSISADVNNSALFEKDF